MIILFLVFFLPLFLQRVIKIQKVICKTQYGDCPQYLLLPYQGDYLSIKKLVESEFEKNSLVMDYLMQYRLPSSVYLDVVIDTPQFAIKYEDKYYMVGTKNVIIFSQSETDLPVLKINKQINSLVEGDSLSEEMIYASKILLGLNWLYSTKEIDFNESIEAKVDDVKLIIPSFGDADYILGAIRIIFSRLNQNDEGLRMNTKEIDLRFNNPILR